MKPRTPAGHPLVSALWIVGVVAIGIAIGLLLAHSFLWLAVFVTGIVAFLSGWIAYLARHARYRGALLRAEELALAGRHGEARAILSPLLAAFPEVPLVQRAAGLLLYRVGDPLSASSLLERALARMDPDPLLVTTLVASYGALNKAGDARRAAAVLANDVDVRLALAWSELVALAGDRTNGARIASALVHDVQARSSPGRRAMLGALAAIVEGHSGRRERTRELLREVEAGAPLLAPADRAFVGYLGGIALREVGDLEGARITFEDAMAAEAESIGAALARRERSHLPGVSSSDPSSESSQPSIDPSSSA